MTTDEVFEALARGNWHRGGLRCCHLFDVDDTYFDQLRAEVLRLIEVERASDMLDPAHPSHSADPYGETLQFSLLNRSGRIDDTTADHDGTIMGKRFHYEIEYPRLGELIKAFPDSLNFRLNELGAHSGLRPHEEHIVKRVANRYTFRVRLHLPIVTSQQATLTLDGERVHFPAGRIFLFNNGCVHDATNESDSPRCHLVWDVLVTADSYRQLFTSAATLPAFLRPCGPSEQIVPVLDRRPIGEFAGSGTGPALYERFRLQRLRIPAPAFQRAFNTLTWARYRLLGRSELATPS